MFFRNAARQIWLTPLEFFCHLLLKLCLQNTHTRTILRIRCSLWSEGATALPCPQSTLPASFSTATCCAPWRSWLACLPYSVPETADWVPGLSAQLCRSYCLFLFQMKTCSVFAPQVLLIGQRLEAWVCPSRMEIGLGAHAPGRHGAGASSVLRWHRNATLTVGKTRKLQWSNSKVEQASLSQSFMSL